MQKAQAIEPFKIYHHILTVNDTRAGTRETILQIMPKEINMIPTGLPSLDKIMKGWHLSDLIVISSCDSGKMTDLAMAIARNLTVDYRIPVVYFSLSMSAVRFVKGLIAMESGHTLSELENFRERYKELEEVEVAAGKLKDAPFYVDDTPELSIVDFKSELKELVGKHGIKLAIIDYVQLMRSHEDAGGREQKLAGIIKALKEAASEFGIAIIALNPTYCAVDAESGAEKYANVMLACRPSESHKPNSVEWVAKISVMKNNRRKYGDCDVKIKKTGG